MTAVSASAIGSPSHGADAEEGAVAETHHAQPSHDGPAGVDKAPQQNLDQHMQRVVADAYERCNCQGGEADPG